MKIRPSTTRPRTSPRGRRTAALARAGLIALALAACSKDGRPSAPLAAAAADGSERYVGRAACASCHAQEDAAWRGSHHDRAMDEANAETVLGDFDDATFTHFGVTSRFFRRDERYFVGTDGPDGELAEFEVAYVFGFAPLQQYLIAFDDGRLQALSIAWDARPAEQGGQRWYHLYPDEPIRAGDELHWTGRQQNWNFMCAECHSTDLRRNYDADTDTFHTTWSEIDVSCETCHGPAARHVEWAERVATGARPARGGDDGLLVHFDERRDVQWAVGFTPGSTHRSRERETTKEIEACGRCHARRGILTEDWVPGRSLLDTHRVALLDQGLYEADGQVLDEVYDYGSFLQSKMYAKGVTCGDCHEPHGLELREKGNGMCLQCHANTRYQDRAHHRHEPGSEASTCVACHMPTHTYMGVDERHDHSFRVPRPDVSARFGTPNACNECHDANGQDAAWAAAAVERWHGPERTGFQDFTAALVAGRGVLDRAGLALAALAQNADAPPIVRATALSLLAAYPPSLALDAVRANIGAADPLLRYGALLALDGTDPRTRWDLAHALLRDPLRVVRIEAAQLLADAVARDAAPEQVADLRAALAEYVAAQELLAERPESWINLGALFLRLGDPTRAEAAWGHALEIEPGYLPAHVNLADLQRARGDDDGCERQLEQALQAAPDNGDAHYAMALLRVRQGRLPEAVKLFQRAVALAPRTPQYLTTLGLALHSAGDELPALAELEKGHELFPGDTGLLTTLATLYRDRGDKQRALFFAHRLVAQDPEDVDAIGLVRSLEQQ